MDARFENILREVAELDPDFVLDAEMSLEKDVGIDSLKLIDIILQIENMFHVELNEDVLASARTVAQLWSAVEAREAQ